MVSPETLRRYSCFGGASDESLRTLAMAGEELSFEAGDVLFQDGDPADHLYIVARGEVDIRYHLGGGQDRTVDTLIAGDMLAWSALVKPFRMTAIGVARTKSRVIAIEASKLREACEAEKKLGYDVMKELARVVSHRLEGARIQLATKT